MGNRLAGLAGTIQAQIVDEEWQKPQQIEESYCCCDSLDKAGLPEQENCMPFGPTTERSQVFG
jgi:hypothetical protein